jgi:hypothetical protein
MHVDGGLFKGQDADNQSHHSAVRRIALPCAAGRRTLAAS